MQLLVVIVHFLTGLALIGLVLIQQGKGAEMGASFGSGGANTVFGSSGGMSFFAKVTGGLAALFFVTSLTLSVMARHAPAVSVASDLPFEIPAQLPAELQTAPIGDIPQAPADGVESAPGDLPTLPVEE